MKMRNRQVIQFFIILKIIVKETVKKINSLEKKNYYLSIEQSKLKDQLKQLQRQIRKLFLLSMFLFIISLLFTMKQRFYLCR